MDTFYEENQENNIRLLKNKMTLDFNSPTSHSKKAKLMKTCILESPDLKMLKLASPELESMIIQQNGLVTTTPTPSSLYTPYFLKQEQEPTEEQEQYARGFVDALNQLHQTNGHQQSSDVPTTTSTGQALNQQQNTSNCLQNYNSNNNNNNQNNSHLNSNSNNNYLNSNAMIIKLESTTGQHTSQQTTQQQQSSQQKSNPSSMNCQLEMRGLSPPMSSSPLPPPQSSLTQPIDMEDQERIKLERKRLRNRIAASKCRRRKLERISKLEDKVKALKGENSELSIVVNKLRDQVCSLKQRVMDHVKCGCQLMVSQ